MTEDQFLRGSGLAQSMPGPLFNSSAYLGAVYRGVAGGLVAWLGMMGPGDILSFVFAWRRMNDHNIIHITLEFTSISF